MTVTVYDFSYYFLMVSFFYPPFTRVWLWKERVLISLCDQKQTSDFLSNKVQLSQRRTEPRLNRKKRYFWIYLNWMYLTDEAMKILQILQYFRAETVHWHHNIKLFPLNLHLDEGIFPVSSSYLLHHNNWTMNYRIISGEKLLSQ